MKKICYITTVSMTLASFVLESAKYIHDKTDWDITFVCDNDNTFTNDLPDYFHFHPIKMKRGVSLSGVKAILEMVEFFKEQKFDLIQYSTPNASFYASLAGKIAKVPNRLYCQWGMAYVGFNGIMRRIFKTIEKIICRLSTWIEPDSFSNLKFAHAERLYPERIGSVIWNGSACGVNLQKYDITKKEKFRVSIRKKHGISEESFVFGFVGRITRDKGINELLASAKRITEQYRNAFFLLVGREEVNESVDRELYNWSKINERVIYTGTTNAVEQYMSAMDCFVLPSYREGFGMTVIEAEAMGVPVIITDIPGPTDGIQKDKTGLVVPRKDIDALHEAMEKMMRSSELRRELGSNAALFARKNFEQKELFKRILADRKKLLGEF